MAKIEKVAGKVQLTIDRFDGGRNVKDAPSELQDTESPSELNVTYDELGSVQTRDGTTSLNVAIGAAPVDQLASYKQTMVAWCGGDMYRLSGTAFVTITSAQDVFASGVMVAHAQYQNVLFCSDGNVAYRYEGGQDFYQHGITIPSNLLGSGGAAGAVIESSTMYYKVAYENTAVVEGEAGGSYTVANANTQVTQNELKSIPTGDASMGVAKRIIYRASTTGGPFKYVGELADNTTSTFVDSMSATTFNAQTRYAVEDGTAPTPYTTVRLHKERLFFDDTDRSVLRWTEYTNPYISKAENYRNLDKGDGGDIKAVAVQDDLITAFLDNAIWVGALQDPSDDLTWSFAKSPANKGIVGPEAFWEGPGYIVFMARSAANVGLGNIFGLCVLQGLDVQDATYGPLRTKSISEKIEPEVLKFPSNLWKDINIMGFDNKIHMACAINGDSSGNAHIYWFDINRMAASDKGQPGSWALWDGLNIRSWVVHEGVLYGGDRASTGLVRRLYADTYADSEAAIDSYWYSKPLGGKTSIDSWIKDYRWLNIWYVEVGSGSWKIYAKSEQMYIDGSSFGGDENLVEEVNNATAASTYGSTTYGSSSYYIEPDSIEGQFSLGTLLARRTSFKFSNANTVGQAFKVLSLKALMNLRRQR